MRKCAVCGKIFERYVQIDSKYIDLPLKYGRLKKTKPELLNRSEYSCPYCYSADRDRMIIMFLKKLRDGMNQGLNFLEIAPSGALQRFLFHNWGKSNLYTADLYMEGVDYTVDIQDMHEIKDGSFDFIVCSHVLEHVQSDTKAIAELYRVLDKKGLGIVIVPLDLSQEYTDEEWGLSEEENWRRFGQGDHVRCYNKNDYIARLKNCGFGVHQITKAYFGDDEFYENALTDTSTLYLVYKNAPLYGDLGKIIFNFQNSHINLDIKREYPLATGQCSYWIDLCESDGNTLKIWGWGFFPEKDSTRTKGKLLLIGGGVNEYIYGITLRKREDIQDKFGCDDYDYVNSGFDVFQSLEQIEDDEYDIFILLQNQDEKCMISCANRLNIKRRSG